MDDKARRKQGDIRMKYYLHIHLLRLPGCYWLFTDNGRRVATKHCLLAEAFDYIDAMRHQIEITMEAPGIDVQLIECSNEIIPTEIKKVLRIE